MTRVAAAALAGHAPRRRREPWMEFHFRPWEAETRGMAPCEVVAYLALMQRHWDDQRALRNDPRWLANACGQNPQWFRWHGRRVIRPFTVSRDGKSLYLPRVMIDIEKRKQLAARRTETAREDADRRWGMAEARRPNGASDSAVQPRNKTSKLRRKPAFRDATLYEERGYASLFI